MDTAARLAEAMREVRIASQSALARASGISQPTINRILKGGGKKGPEAHTLVKLAAACNVSFGWLHEGKLPKSRIDSVVDENVEIVDQQNAEAPLAQVQRLLNLFCATDDAGRESIMSAAEVVRCRLFSPEALVDNK